MGKNSETNQIPSVKEVLDAIAQRILTESNSKLIEERQVVSSAQGGFRVPVVIVGKHP